VPPQGAAPDLGARPQTNDLFRDQTIAEPDNLFDHYEGRPRTVAAVTMKVGEDMNKTDLKTDIPGDLKGDALRKWGYRTTCDAFKAWTTMSDGFWITWMPSGWLPTRS
jgi:hypothetical protein